MKKNLSPIIQLAPMQGVMDPYLREIYSEIGGYDLMVTEFVRVTQTLLSNKVFWSHSPELKKGGFTKNHTPVFIQLLGSDPQLMAENAQKAAELGAPGIDLNFGCPAKTVNRHMGGSILLKTPDLLFKIANQVRKNLPKSVALTGKVRLGYEDKKLYLENAQALEAGGVKWITVHARTKVEGYQAPAHWEYVAKIQSEVKVPIFNNGEIWSSSDYQKAYRVSGCHHVALGRGALCHPHLAHEIKGASFTSWGTIQKLVLKQFINICIDNKSENFALIRLKQWLNYLKKQFPEAEILFQKIKLFKNFDDFKIWFQEYENKI